ncbi:S8 family serine peptidase [Streptomyces sp. NPDC048297]|uniref:S8 family serine peptidase n=1 Tax=Streptomyces sp. NPDC048297 TaxID=3365531 RepID=UPI00371625A1
MRVNRRRVVPLIPAVALVASTAAPGVAAAASGATLPVVVQVLADNAPCRPASAKRAPQSPWTQDMLALDRVWRLSRGAGVAVGVVGSGVGKTIPALSGRVTALGATGGQDCVGHGSFVAGLIAAGPYAGSGFTGVAPDARILAVRATAPRGAATGPGLARGIKAVVAAGAKVVAVPWALDKKDAKLTEAVRYANAHDVLVVAPAVPDKAGFMGSGEAGKPHDFWPAAEPGVLSVLDFGADGSRPQGAAVPRHADLAAPGDRVVSVGPGGDGAFTGSGSSLAVGFVAGAAALVRAYRPDLSAQQTRTRLLGGSYPAAVPRLDPYAAVSGVVPSPADSAPALAAPVRLPPEVHQGNTRARSFLVAAAGAGVALFVGVLGWVVPRARARRWRAG